jgi:hypothetical protein
MIDIDGQRRQISIRRPTSETSQRADEAHDFFFDAVYDWKYVFVFFSNLSLSN